jgi:hypothetical protein
MPQVRINPRQHLSNPCVPLVRARCGSYGQYCWANVRTVSPWTRIQTPESGSNSFSELVPATICASSAAVIVVAGNGPPLEPLLVRTVPCTSAGTR